MKRVFFSATGEHPLLYVVRDYLILQGYALVPFGEETNFVLAGFKGSPDYGHALPTLLLSSSSVYGDRDHLLGLRERAPMDEAHGHVVTSSLDPSAVGPITALLSEWQFLNRPIGKTIVVRPFNVFGPSVEHGVVHEFLQAARENRPLQVHSPGRQTRTFLYEDDFLDAVGSLVSRLLRGLRGVYNLGSSESVEILSLAKSVGHAFGIAPDIQIIETAERHAWWKLPALDRARVDAKLRTRVSLRAALFQMARKHV